MRTFISLLAWLGIAAMAHAQNQGETMKDQSATQTLCLGRFLVDVPKDAYVVGNASEYRWDKIKVSKGISQDKFQQALVTKENQLKGVKHKTDPSVLRYVGKNSEGLPNVFIFWETPTSRGVLETESFKRLRGNQFLIKGNVDPEKVAIAVDMANRSLSELQYRGDKEIPTQPGFCVDGGLFTGEPSFPHYESAFLNLQFKSHPDIRVSISTETNSKQPDQGLLARIDSKPIPSFLFELNKRSKVLRRGMHPVGNVQAEEHLESVPTGETFSTHIFFWEASGKAQDIYAPGIVVEMQTGKPTLDGYERPTVSDREALLFFDTIVNSIRLRPITESH